MKNWIGLGVIALLFSACGEKTTTKEVVLATFEDSISFAIGSDVALDVKGGISQQGLDTQLNAELLIAGFRDAYLNDTAKFSKEDGQAVISEFFNKKKKEEGDNNVAKGQDFLAENLSKPGVKATASGLQYIVLKEGEGASPLLSSQVRVHYTGKLLSGKVFDSSIERNEPVEFFVRSVIPGWTEALQLMKPGAEYKLFIPSDLAYGAQGGPRGSAIGPNEVLIFDVKLIDVLN